MTEKNNILPVCIGAFRGKGDKTDIMAFGIYNYRKTGSGVSKDAPRKKPFFLYWEIFGNKFWKFFQINLIYVLFCIPIVTFGPATAAMTQLMRKFTIGEPIFVFHEFYTTFKKNFKQSVVVGIVDVLFCVLLVFNMNFYSQMFSGDDTFTKVMLALSIAMGFFVIMMHFYIYPQIVALQLNLRQIVKNSLILMIVGFKRSFIAFFVWAGLLTVVFLLLPYSVIALPFVPFAWMSFTATFCAYPVIQKHIIDPYYEARGEKNPEYARYESSEEERVFEDMGGKEAPTEIAGEKKNSGGAAPKGERVKVRTKGKVIK